MFRWYKYRTLRHPATLLGAACTTVFIGFLLLNRLILNSATCVAGCATDMYIYERLQKNEASKKVRHPTVKSFDVNYLGSNSPIEDRFVVGFNKNLGLGLFSVIDGHKGHRCSHFLQNHILQFIISTLKSQVATDQTADVEILMNMNFTSISTLGDASLEDSNDNTKAFDHIPTSVVEECLTASFKSLDEHISSQALSDIKLVLQGHAMAPDMRERIMRAIEGACVTLAMVQANTISVATTGDCRVVLGQQHMDNEWTALPLSVDQNVNNALEVQRVKSAHPGEEDTVIFNGRILGSLMPFRSFGDVDFKWEKQYLEGIVPVWPYYQTPPYMTAEPVVTHHKLQKADKFMIIASDGLWERISSEKAVNVVAASIEHKGEQTSTFSLKSLFGKTTDEQCCVKNAATELLWHALGGSDEAVSKLLDVAPNYSRMVRDDITITVVFFK